MRVAAILFVALCLTSCPSKKSCHEEDVKDLLCDDSVVLKEDEDFDELLCDHVISKYVTAGRRVPNGTTCFAPVETVHPTQSSIGGLMKQCKSHKIEKKDKEDELISYLNRKPAPGIVGPDFTKKDAWKIWITDHHHLASALSISFEDKHEKLQKYRLLRICVINDLIGEESKAFETKMEQNGWLWLHDRKGRRIGLEDIPHKISKLHDDPFRSLAQYVREGFGFIKCDGEETEQFSQCKDNPVERTPFFEFMWGNFLRTVMHHDLNDLYDLEPSKNKDKDDQIDIFNRHVREAMLLASNLNVLKMANKTDLNGQNTDREFIQHVKVDKDGCIDTSDNFWEEL